MTNTKYEELQALTRNYGLETLAFFSKVNSVGPQIVEAYANYLDGPKAAAKAVPPDGDFDHGKFYRGASCFSYSPSRLTLELIRMGVRTEIENQRDAGATWVRTVIEFQPKDNGFLLSIGNHPQKFRDPSNLDAIMPDICEEIFQDVREAFSLELDQAQGQMRMGFI